MNRDAENFLKKLVETPSPSGFEQKAQSHVRARLKGVVDSIETDVHGNVIGVLNPDAKMRVMLSGHCDEIGLMITHIDNDGYLFIAAIGGIDPVVLAGQRVEIHSEKGAIQGVIGRKAIHLLKPEERTRPTMNLQQFWVDIGAKDRKDALKVVAIGDPITICRKYCALRNGLVAARGFDDRVGAWVVVETLRKLKNAKLNVAVYGVSSVQEEIGLRGARTACYGIDPDIGIAIDVGHTSDIPGSDKKITGEVFMGKGPILHRGPNINPRLATFMEKTAKAKRIPVQMTASPRATGTDANAMQVSRAGVATALVSIPNRYMHTPVEVVSLKDLDQTVNLLAAIIRDLKPTIRLTP
jgi:tetrahedral aminopeptidase